MTAVPGHDDHTSDTPDHEPDNPQGVWCCDEHEQVWRKTHTFAPSPPVGGHGPHDNQPHWTVELTDPDDVLVLGNSFPVTEIGVEIWDGDDDIWCTYNAGDEHYAALVRAVRDAAEVPALRTHATTLQRARELAAEFVDAEREVYLLEGEYDETLAKGYDRPSRQAALDRLSEARHRYVDARKALLDLLTGETDA